MGGEKEERCIGGRKRGGEGRKIGRLHTIEEGRKGGREERRKREMHRR